MTDEQAAARKNQTLQQNPQTLFEQARLAEKEGRSREAVRLYDEILSTFKDNEQASEIVQLSRDLRASAYERMQPESMGPMQVLPAATVGFGIWILMGMGIAAIFSDGVRAWWEASWLWVIIASIGVVLLFGAARWLEKKLALQNEAKKQAVYAFLIIPLITLTMMAVIALGASRMALVLELILILVAALVPAVTYYVFIVMRRPSIFNEFLANLSGLGLLSPHPVRQRLENEQGNVYVHVGYESPEERRARVEGYLQRFESIYGALRFDTAERNPISRPSFVAKLIDAIDRRTPDLPLPEAAVRLTDIFRANLVIPIGLATILTTLGWLITIQPDLIAAFGEPAAPMATKVIEPAPVAELSPTLTPAGFAFLGAYFFGIQMIFRRFVRRDLGPNAYMAFSNRILLALIATWVVLAIYTTLPSEAANLAADTTAVLTGTSDEGQQNLSPWIFLLAFVLGVFPRVLWQFINELATRVLPIKLVIPAVETKQPLSLLDGLTIWHEARLEEEDVENVPNMATVNVVDLLLHTQIPAERLVSWIDQAILYTVLGPDDDDGQQSRLSRLRKLGLRSASQVVESWDGGGDEQAAVKAALGNIEAATVVRSLKLESNFSPVNAWRAATKYE